MDDSSLKVPSTGVSAILGGSKGSSSTGAKGSAAASAAISCTGSACSKLAVSLLSVSARVEPGRIIRLIVGDGRRRSILTVWAERRRAAAGGPSDGVVSSLSSASALRTRSRGLVGFGLG